MTPHGHWSKSVYGLARTGDHDEHVPQQRLGCSDQSTFRTVSFSTNQSKFNTFCYIPTQIYRYFTITLIPQKEAAAGSSNKSVTCTSLTQQDHPRCLLWLVLIGLSRGNCFHTLVKEMLSGYITLIICRDGCKTDRISLFKKSHTNVFKNVMTGTQLQTFQWNLPSSSSG
jgi:hypothetical protein